MIYNLLSPSETAAATLVLIWLFQAENEQTVGAGQQM